MDRPLFEPTSVPHPGEVVLDYLEDRAWSQRDLARRTGLSPKLISEICNGKTVISAASALALENALGRPAHFWMNLQARFDEATLRQRARAQSPDWITWAQAFPLGDMKKRRWLPAATSSPQADATNLLAFLGVSSPDSWNAVWSAAQVAYRQTRRFPTNPWAIAAWVRATELDAAPTPDFDADRLTQAIPHLRHLTRERIEEALPAAEPICRDAGVAFVIVPELPHTGISGCARWLNDRRAILAITLRYKTDDQIWFTFFHELAHLLLHRRQSAFILDNAAEELTDRVVDPQMERMEEEANRYAAELLIPPQELARFIAQATFTNDAIHDFAEHLDIGPGILVGRLQRLGVLAPHQGNRLKQRVNWTTQPAPSGEEPT